MAEKELADSPVKSDSRSGGRHESSTFSPLNDLDFDRVYPNWIQKMSKCHWTPMGVAKMAADFLVTRPGTRVLDIGCGPGKFCAVGAATTEGHFTGIEQRSGLASIARRTMHELGLSQRVEIIHANVTEVEFRHYDAFYLFNPFTENIFPIRRIDSTVELDRHFYDVYTNHVRDQLNLAPLGTRVATYHCDLEEIPKAYEWEKQAFDGYLKLWVKNRADPPSEAEHRRPDPSSPL